ncbi:MAG: hypothetical protein HRF50_16865 [Phycisphaerae bacterium]|jgi:hypothetical protein
MNAANANKSSANADVLSATASLERAAHRVLSKRRHPDAEDRRVNPELGLCGTCSRAAECNLRAKLEPPVIYCEEFDDAVEQVREPEPQVENLPAAAALRVSPLKGLCVNCVHRDTCTLPKSEMGVWHCEEYE